MMRRALTIGVLAVGMVFTTLHTTPFYCRITCSARGFRHRFHDLEKSGKSLSTVERIVLSLMLASDDAADAGDQATSS